MVDLVYSGKKGKFHSHGVCILLCGPSLAFPQGTYEPGKRHWLKVKKDYLNEGAMADTADLVVLGAFYGQGSKGQCI
jgi:hypothetical protein